MDFMGTNRVSLADCTVLSIARLYKSTREMIKKEYDDLTREEHANIALQSMKSFTINGQNFDFEMFTSPLDNDRWYLLCPKCKKRTTKLFLPPEGHGYENKYLCKFCHNIKPKCSIMGPTRFYKYVYRPLKKMRDIEQKLEKSNRIPTEKIERLLEEYRRIEEQMKQTPEYKLYEFKKRRGLEN